MVDWDERFTSGDYPHDREPAPLLRRYVDALPTGRAMDVATGTGRNAVFLAGEGYEVEALDRSREGLEITQERAQERDVADRVECVQTDLSEHAFPEGRYDLVTISFYRAMDRFPDILDALAPDGVLFYEHHLRAPGEYESGPSTNRYRFGANELLNACLDLTVLAFDARTERRPDGRRATRTQIVARNSTGRTQAYPEVGIDPR